MGQPLEVLMESVCAAVPLSPYVKLPAPSSAVSRHDINNDPVLDAKRLRTRALRSELEVPVDTMHYDMDSGLKQSAVINEVVSIKSTTAPWEPCLSPYSSRSSRRWLDLATVWRSTSCQWPRLSPSSADLGLGESSSSHTNASVSTQRPCFYAAAFVPLWVITTHAATLGQ